MPSGLSETRQGRSRDSNYREAKQALVEKIIRNNSYENLNKISELKKNQMGSGMRGDKIRTYRFQDDVLIDHVNNRKYSVKKIMKGYFDLLWK